ncbi:unnamed protein product, partial [Rotaria sp. Silwood2]
MGTKTSKQKNDYSYSQDNTSYDNVLRSYAKWQHSSALVSHDESRFTTNEIRNFNKHNFICQNSPNPQKENESNIKNQSLSNRKIEFNSSYKDKFHSDHSKYDKICQLERSQSIDQLSHSNNIITAKQLVICNSQQRIKYRSDKLNQSSDQIFLNENIQKSLLKTNKNQFISSNNKKQKIPADLQFILINQYDLQ